MITITKSDAPETDALFKRKQLKRLSHTPVAKLCMNIEQERHELKGKCRAYTAEAKLLKARRESLKDSRDSIISVLMFLNSN